MSACLDRVERVGQHRQIDSAQDVFEKEDDGGKKTPVNRVKSFRMPLNGNATDDDTWLEIR